ncbi:MAG: hypothetical protein JWO13_270 [Acidobacteriales bacterium]|nr:hypothetical protein [Terriglobales bacterium]
MYQYESSPFTNVNPSQSTPFQNFQGSAFQNPQSQGYANRFGVSANMPPFQSAFAFQGPQPFQGFTGSGYQSSPFQASPFQTSPFQSSPFQTSPFPGASFQGSPYQSTPYQTSQAGFENVSSRLSPEEFAGSLGSGRFSENRLTNLALVDPIFITELSRSARGLQDVAEQLEGIQSPGQSQSQSSSKDDTQRKGIYAATAHLFYTFGLLASKGIFITGDMPGKIRTESGGPANACREFGKQLERFVDKAATGRGVTEELSRLVERGTACYAEITRTIEGSETSDQTTRKKVAA